MKRMSAEQFYDLFKMGLKALDVSWYDKDSVEVKIKDEYFVMKYGDLKFSIHIKTKEQKK